MSIPQVFSLAQAVAVANVPERQLLDWDASGVMHPQDFAGAAERSRRDDVCVCGPCHRERTGPAPALP